MKGTLYVVGTPIGNLSDFSPRGLETLRKVDFIAAEDTRVTLKLLSAFGIKKPLMSCHEHNIQMRTEEILAKISDGLSCAIVTDAGMPCISDPGELVVARCRAEGIRVEAVPGPTALTTALAVSGFGVTRFCFEGFLSTGKHRRLEHLEEIKNHRETLVFYEAPHKLLATLEDLMGAFGNRKVTVARELTKIHEEVLSGTLEEMRAHFEEHPPRGEFVLIVEGASPPAPCEEITLEQAAQQALQLMEEGYPASRAAKEAALKTGHKKGDIYKKITDREDR